MSTRGGGTQRTTVIIPAHNAASTIGRQLESLIEQLRPGIEVVVVLNRCTDETGEIVGRFERSTEGAVRAITANERPGASYARNCGVRVASGQWLLFCDADDIVGPQWVEQLRRELRSRDVVAGRLEPLGHVPSAVRRTFPLIIDAQRNELPVHAGRIRFAMTASMGCTRQAFDAAGGFDERFSYGADDVVFCLRAQQAGLRMGFSSGAVCGYRLRSTQAEITRQRRAYARGAAQLIVHYLPELDRGVSGDLTRLLRQSVRVMLPIPLGLTRRRWTLLRSSATASLSLARSRVRAGTPWRLRPSHVADGAPMVPFTAPVGMAIVGGLGFADLTTGDVREDYGTTIDPILRLLDRILEPGDEIVMASERPVPIVAAGLRTAPHGAVRVVAMSRELITHNVAIHSTNSADVDFVSTTSPNTAGFGAGWEWVAEQIRDDTSPLAVAEVPVDVDPAAFAEFAGGRTWWQLPINTALRGPAEADARWLVGIVHSEPGDHIERGLSAMGARRLCR